MLGPILGGVVYIGLPILFVWAWSKFAARRRRLEQQVNSYTVQPVTHYGMTVYAVLSPQGVTTGVWWSDRIDAVEYAQRLNARECAR